MDKQGAADKLGAVSEDLVILGAGPCGLAAGLELAGHGALAPTLVDRHAEPGGLCRTWRHGPFAVDLSIHRLQFERAGLPPDLAALFAGQLHHVRRKTIHIGLEGRRLPYPLRPASLVRLPRGRLARAAVQYLGTRLGPGDGADEASYRAWFEARLGEELWRWITGPLMEKQWGVDGHRLSAELGRTRRLSVGWGDLLAGLPLVGALFRRGIPVDFLYGREGCGALMQLLARRAEQAGGRLLGGREPRRILRQGRQVRAVELDDGQRLPVSQLISTIPLPALVELLHPAAPAQVRQAAARLRFRDMLVVAVALDRPRVSRDHVTYYPEPRFPFSRTFESKNASPTMAPAGRTMLGFEVPCQRGDELWSADDQHLVQWMTGFGPDVGFDPAEARGGFVFRVREAYPLYEVGHRARADLALQWLHEALDNLFVVGRNGLFRLDNMNHALTMGADLGRHVAAGMGPKTWHRLLPRYANFSYID